MAPPRGFARGPKHVEPRPAPQLTPRDRGEPERRMKDRREKKADPRLLDASSHSFGGQVDLHAQLLKHVGGSAQRGGGTVAVLGDLGAASSGDDRRKRRDVEGGEPI